jgi:hypothetical protein
MGFRRLYLSRLSGLDFGGFGTVERRGLTDPAARL